jgi:NADPH:quinone reductase-like Zn-dependent oxidoreductase
MNQAIEQHKIKPVIDKTFVFEDVRDALKYMESGSHFGKIAVQI